MSSRLAAAFGRCVVYHLTMFGPVSHVSPHRCQLFTVERTDLRTWERITLSYPPSDQPTAVRRAADYQRWFDPERSRWDFRCGMCS